MKRLFSVLVVLVAAGTFCTAQTDSLSLQEVVVTGTRNAVDMRHLPYTVNVIGRQTLTEQQQTSVLPTVMQQVPGLMVTSRSMMGYGVSTGAAGGINLRGLTGGTGQMLVLIDGHPQYNGVYGHPISDSYQTLMADRVEVLRGPASVLYGSNAMGGVLNIVTRSMHEDGVKTISTSARAVTARCTRKPRTRCAAGAFHLLSQHNTVAPTTTVRLRASSSMAAT